MNTESVQLGQNTHLTFIWISLCLWKTQHGILQVLHIFKNAIKNQWHLLHILIYIIININL